MHVSGEGWPCRVAAVSLGTTLLVNAISKPSSECVSEACLEVEAWMAQDSWLQHTRISSNTHPEITLLPLPDSPQEANHPHSP